MNPANQGWSVPHYIDASIAVKLLTPETESARLHDYLLKNVTYHFYITEFAFYEVLSVLKRKLINNEIDQHLYFNSVAQLIGYRKDNLLQIDSDFRLDNFKVFLDVGELVKKHSLDYSDALQIYTIQNGKWSQESYDCKTIFITADSHLADAARIEGLRVWNPLKEPSSPAWDDSNSSADHSSSK